MAENDACHNTATQRRMLLLEIVGRGAAKLAEDAGFEPARAVNPTRVPGERHRPLGESSAGYGSRPARCALRVARGTSPVRPPSPSGWVGPQLARGVPPPLHKPAGALVLHSLRTPRGVYPVNS